jgi:hypothetical protein
LKELFEFSNYYLYFLTEAVRPNLSNLVTKALPYPLASFEEKADSSTALLGPHTLEQDDLGITSYTNCNGDRRIGLIYSILDDNENYPTLQKDIYRENRSGDHPKRA